MVECWVICLAAILVTHQMDPVQLIMSLYRRVLWINYYILEYQILYQLCQIHIVNQNGNYKQENISNDNILHPMSPNYIWDDESAVRFTMALGSDEIQNQLQLFNSKTILGS